MRSGGTVGNAPPPGLTREAHPCETCLVQVRVRLFASLREAAGRSEVELRLPPAATTEDAWRALSEQYPALLARRSSLAASVNRRYAPFETPLHEGDELVFIPPVSGG